MSDEESDVVFYGAASISLVLTTILLTIFWFCVVNVSRTESVAVAPTQVVARAQLATSPLTIEDIDQLRRQVGTSDTASHERIAEAHQDFELRVQAHEQELELQRQKGQIDVLLAVRQAEIEQVRQEVLLAETEHLRKKQEAISTALSQLSRLRQAEGASPTGAQQTSASF
jgi:hypothetical protein